MNRHDQVLQNGSRKKARLGRKALLKSSTRTLGENPIKTRVEVNLAHVGSKWSKCPNDSNAQIVLRLKRECSRAIRESHGERANHDIWTTGDQRMITECSLDDHMKAKVPKDPKTETAGHINSSFWILMLMFWRVSLVSILFTGHWGVMLWRAWDMIEVNYVQWGLIWSLNPEAVHFPRRSHQQS